jgi:hypothetical protein
LFSERPSDVFGTLAAAQHDDIVFFRMWHRCLKCLPGLSRAIDERLGHWFEDGLFLIVHNYQAH